MKSLTPLPSGVGQSLPKICKMGRLPIITSWTTGIKLVGKADGSSPISPVQWAPTGLKYLREISFQFLCGIANDFINISTQDLDQAYGLLGSLTSDSLQPSLSPYTAAVEENIKWTHCSYFSIILNRFIEPTKLFSQYSRGLKIDQFTAFLAAKCIIPSIGQFLSTCSLNILSRQSRSNTLPLTTFILLLISQGLNFQDRIFTTLSITSSQQFEKSSTTIRLAPVLLNSSTIVFEPTKPKPPGIKRF